MYECTKIIRVRQRVDENHNYDELVRKRRYRNLIRINAEFNSLTQDQKGKNL